MSIVINDVHATKLSVECAKTKQMKAIFTYSYFIVATVVTCALNDLILSFLLHTLGFSDVHCQESEARKQLA